MIEGTDHLLRNHDHGLYRKSSVAVVEQVLQARAKEVNDENVMEAFLAKVVNIGNTGCVWLGAERSCEVEWLTAADQYLVRSILIP